MWRFCCVPLTVWLSSIVCLKTVVAFNINTELSKVISGPRDTYFGFSLGVLTDDSRGTRFIVGAPKANSSFNPGHINTGSVFDCNLQGTCVEMDMGVSRTSNLADTYGQHLGFSIAVQSGVPNKITACAPLSLLTKIPGYHFVQGLCYEIGYRKDSTYANVYQPMKPGRSGINKLFFEGEYMKANGEGGFTALYTDDSAGSAELVVGAPGYFDWRGGVVFIDNTATQLYTPTVLGKTTSTDSYNGYSLCSGRFFSRNKVSIVSGSPNWNYTGKVFVFESDLSDITLAHQGEQVGSYYGASVLAVDVNGDGYDDLLVGAPLYSLAVEEGKVYVYISNSLDYLTHVSSLKGPGIRNGRFGTAMESPGDLNNDGFNDVVIGAPYVGGSGAIYVYQGSRQGLATEPSQSILGKSIDPGLRGFGWAFSKGIDSDKNDYPDFSVSSVESNQIVTMNTIPVATIRADISLHNSVVSTKTRCAYMGRYHRCVRLDVTFSYIGVGCPDKLQIEYELRADTFADHDWEAGRAQFLTGGNLTASIHRNISLVRDKSFAITYQAIVQPRMDAYTDIGFTLAFKKLWRCGYRSAVCPILDKRYPTNIHKQVPFLKDCGKKNVCVSDLVLKTFVPNEIVIGSKDMSVKVIVQNKGEPAYLSTVELRFDADIQLIGVLQLQTLPTKQVYCSLTQGEATSKSADQNSTFTSLRCFTGNPLPANGFVQFVIKLDVSRLTPASTFTTISLRAETRSDERNITLQDNFVKKTILLKRDFDLEIQSISLPEQLRYRSVKRIAEANDKDNRLLLRHQYVVASIGHGSSPEISVAVGIPMENKGRKLFHITSVEVLLEGAGRDDLDWDCRRLEPSANPADRAILGQLPHQQTSSDVTFMNCLTSSCSLVTCRIRELKSGQSAVVSVDGWIQESFFSEHKSNGFIKLQTNATVYVEQQPGNVDSFSSGHFHVTTEVFGHATEPKSWWIIAVGFAVTLFLIAILVIILWKVGFFRRRYKEDMHRLIEDEESNNEMRSIRSPEEQGEQAVVQNDYSEPPTPDATEVSNLLDHVVPVTHRSTPRSADYLHPTHDDYLHPSHVDLPPLKTCDASPDEHTYAEPMENCAPVDQNGTKIVN